MMVMMMMTTTTTTTAAAAASTKTTSTLACNHFSCYLQNVTGARPEDMHVIGHSLGSHVAGYAGERLRNLGRITGCQLCQ
jgi:thioesterase domain-containing protein